MFSKLKILVVGPCESGKTAISNFLSDASEMTSGAYRPTKGVRILETEIDGVDVGANQSVTVEVALWDCSGDQSFEICWPSMQKGVNGVIFVYNPGVPRHLKELEVWHLHFAKELGIRDQQCLVLAHQKPGITGEGKILGGMSRIQLMTSNIDEDPDALQEQFKDFLGNVLTFINDRNEQEELSILE